MKICKRCNKELPLNLFNKSVQKSKYTGELATYYSTYCKECGKLICKERRQTVRGMFTDIYNGQLRSSKTRGHVPPNYSQKELQEWMQKQPNFSVLVTAWKQFNYNRWYKPSCDRLDNNKPYTLSNLRLVSAGENNDAAYQDRRVGKLLINERAVNQYYPDETYVQTFNTIISAAKATGAASGNIVNCCRGKYKTSKGFIWRYADGA